MFNFVLKTNTNKKQTQFMAKSVLHLAESRGMSNFGWLFSTHTFSFGDYYDPDRIHFGALRVINDDIVAPGKGFGSHQHSNMEIITIPLEGDLEHKDSMNNVSFIRNGDIQVISAGMGIYHSEYNKNKDRSVRFLQIWVLPNQKNVLTRYDQKTLDRSKSINQLQQILSPDETDEGVWIYQDTWFHSGKLDAGVSLEYRLKNIKDGVYIFVLQGDVEVNDQKLKTRDGYRIWEVEQFNITALSDCEILLMEVPMIV